MNRQNKSISAWITALLALGILSGCGSDPQTQTGTYTPFPDHVYQVQVTANGGQLYFSVDMGSQVGTPLATCLPSDCNLTQGMALDDGQTLTLQRTTNDYSMYPFVQVINVSGTGTLHVVMLKDGIQQTSWDLGTNLQGYKATYRFNVGPQ